MKRRKFLIGTGGTAIGGSALLGSGAFTRIESQRRAKIEVVKDPDAYLGLDGCPDSPNSSYTRLDDSGHLEIEMSPDNPTEGGGQGINSDSFSYFDNVFQICNQGKQEVAVWIDEFETLDLDPEYEDEPTVDFYLNDDDEVSLVGEENAVLLAVGECLCVGIRTVSKGLEEEDQLIVEDEIVINADAGVDVVEEPPEVALTPNADPEVELEDQFETLTATEFGTNAIEVCVEKEGVDGETGLGVQVTDHHGTFQETPTTWNPGSTFLQPVTIEFEDGEGCFTIGNPGVDDVALNLLPIDGGLLTVDDIENIAVAVDGEEPDSKVARGVDVETAGMSTADNAGFDEYETDR